MQYGTQAPLVQAHNATPHAFTPNYDDPPNTHLRLDHKAQWLPSGPDELPQHLL